MFRIATSLVIWVLTVAQLLSWAVMLSEETALAQTGTEKCCWPAFAGTPTAPPGSGTSCKYIAGGNPACDNTGATMTCTGGAWQNAFPGFCKTQAGAWCSPPSPSGPITNVTIKNGYWKCNTQAQDQATCTCKWYANDPVQTDTKSVGNCTGDACN